MWHIHVCSLHTPGCDFFFCYLPQGSRSVSTAGFHGDCPWCRSATDRIIGSQSVLQQWNAPSLSSGCHLQCLWWGETFLRFISCVWSGETLLRFISCVWSGETLLRFISSACDQVSPYWGLSPVPVIRWDLTEVYLQCLWSGKTILRFISSVCDQVKPYWGLSPVPVIS